MIPIPMRIFAQIYGEHWRERIFVMSEVTENFEGSLKIGDALMLALGLAILPVVLLVAPRFAIISFLQGNAVSRRSKANEEFFAKNRQHDETDATRYETLCSDLDAKISAGDWVAIADPRNHGNLCDASICQDRVQHRPGLHRGTRLGLSGRVEGWTRDHLHPRWHLRCRPSHLLGFV